MPTTSDQALYTVLSAASALTALLSVADAGGPAIYPVEAPQGALQNILVWQIISTQSQTTHAEGGDDSRLDGVYVQLTALAPTQLQASAIMYQARVAIESSVTLKGIMTSEQSLARDENALCHGRTADFMFWNYPDL